MNNIDLDLYRIVYLVKKNGSFSKTSEELNTTQPAISYKVNKLEQLLGFKIFDRESRPLQLTPEGKILMPFIENSLLDIKRGLKNVDEFKKLEVGELIIGVPSHISIFLLTDKIKEFNKLHPKIKIKLVSKHTRELFKLLGNNELDLIIDSAPFDNYEMFNVKKISTEKCLFSYNLLNTKIEENREYSLKEMNELNIPIIVPSFSTSSTKELRKKYKELNVDFTPLYEASTSEMIIEMVRQNIGIGFLFEKMIFRYPELKILNCKDELPTFDIYVIAKENCSSLLCQDFLNLLFK